MIRKKWTKYSANNTYIYKFLYEKKKNFLLMKNYKPKLNVKYRISTIYIFLFYFSNFRL
jgi:hypothetical protein